MERKIFRITIVIIFIIATIWILILSYNISNLCSVVSESTIDNTSEFSTPTPTEINTIETNLTNKKFTIGSTISEVINAMGMPTSILDDDKGRQFWYYNNSMVKFVGNEVVEVDNYDDNLQFEEKGELNE